MVTSFNQTPCLLKEKQDNAILRETSPSLPVSTSRAGAPREEHQPSDLRAQRRLGRGEHRRLCRGGEGCLRGERAEEVDHWWTHAPP